MSDNGTLPGCFSLRKPLPPNRCETCRYREECKKYVLKVALQPILAKLERLETVLREARGEKFE
jgi:hypothetical protein